MKQRFDSIDSVIADLQKGRMRALLDRVARAAAGLAMVPREDGSAGATLVA